MNCTIEEYIREHLLNKYEIIYNKKIVIEQEGDSYSLFFELNNKDRPIMIGGQFESDEDFAKYVTKELDRRQLFKTKYFLLLMNEKI